MTDVQAPDLLARDPQAADLQAQYAPAVLANELNIDARWGTPWVGYLLFLRPDRAASAALTAVQDIVLALEPSLRRQPEAALHSMVAFVAPESPVPESTVPDHSPDEIWQQRGAEWLAVIASGTRAMAAGPFRLHFRRLIATDAAIIAVADPPNPVTELRRTLAAGLNLPWPLAKGPLVHVTLCRYGQPLRDPAALLRRIQAMELAIETEVSELLLVRQATFPALKYSVLHRLAIGGPAA